MAVFDITFLYVLNDLSGRSDVLDALIIFFASYLAYLVPFILLSLVFFSAYARRTKWEIILVAGLSSAIARLGVVEIIRFFWQRPRPFSVLPVNQLLTDTAPSFPSGHAAFFFAMATAVYFYNRAWGRWLYVAAALIAIGRIAAGVHYPSDIIAGALIGVAAAGATVLVIRQLPSFSPKRSK